MAGVKATSARRTAAPKESKIESKVREADIRGRILEAALALFEEKGFDATAVPEVARRAGIATGSIYRHFESKDALVNALYRHWKQVYHARVLTGAPIGASHRALFTHYWTAMASFARENSKAARFLDLHHHRGYLDSESQVISEDFSRTAGAFVQTGVKAGVLKPIAPALLLALMHGSMRGLIQFSADGQLTLDEDTVRTAEACVWDAIKV